MAESSALEMQIKANKQANELKMQMKNKDPSSAKIDELIRTID